MASTPTKAQLMTSLEDKEVEIFEAANFLLAIFTGDEANGIISNSSIERRLGYYLFEVFAAVNLHRGSLRFAPCHVSSRVARKLLSSSKQSSTPAPSKTSKLVLKNDSPSKKQLGTPSVYPSSPLEVRKFLFLKQVSVFPWHFPLSRITLATHIGLQLLGETVKEETVQLFCLLPSKELSFFLTALATAFPVHFRDFLRFSHLSSELATKWQVQQQQQQQQQQQERLLRRHTQCVAPLFQCDSLKVSFYSFASSSWTRWQWCALQVRAFEHLPPPQQKNELRILPSKVNREQLQNMKRLAASERFALHHWEEATAYVGPELSYWLDDVAISLADVAVQSTSHRRSLSRRLFADDDPSGTDHPRGNHNNNNNNRSHTLGKVWLEWTLGC
jgi:hypothetical protein